MPYYLKLSQRHFLSAFLSLFLLLISAEASDPFAELEEEVQKIEEAPPAAETKPDEEHSVSAMKPDASVNADEKETGETGAKTSAGAGEDWGVSEDGRTSIARIENLQGTVLLLEPGNIRRKKTAAGQIIYEQDIIMTQSNASATLNIVDGSTIVLAERARLEARSSEEFFQQEGIAYFDVRRRSGESRFAVNTKFALIGVKGTEFIVNAKPFSGRVALNKGEIDITNPDDEPYALTKRQPLSFEDFARQRQQGFADYKKKIVEEFTQYKKSFSLEAGKRLIFNGNSVQEDDLEHEDNHLFERFRRLR